MSGRGYRDLIAWQKAMELAEATYAVSVDLPIEEKYGLTSQLRRAAVSVPSNISEGHGRSSPKDFARFIEHAMGSLFEVETQLMLSVRLKMLRAENVDRVLEQAAEVGRILNGLLRSLQ
jgi:four helix bundle protein